VFNLLCVFFCIFGLCACIFHDLTLLTGHQDGIKPRKKSCSRISKGFPRVAILEPSSNCGDYGKLASLIQLISRFLRYCPPLFDQLNRSSSD